VEDPADRGLERLVAREVELREREARLSESQKEMETLRARLAELEGRPDLPSLADKIKLSPVEGLRALGLDPDEVVRMALVEKLGDKANTPEMREMMERVRIRKEMESLRAQVQEAERARAAQAYYAEVQSKAAEYVKNQEGISKHAPLLATVAKANPDRVLQEVMEEISKDAATRASREPAGDILSFQEAAQRVERRWAAMKALLEPTLPSASAPASTPEPKTTPTAAPVKSTPPSSIKPPERPLAPWLTAQRDEEEAIKEAVLEWTRAESAKRR
jgi:hypothetical protein